MKNYDTAFNIQTILLINVFVFLTIFIVIYFIVNDFETFLTNHSSSYSTLSNLSSVVSNSLKPWIGLNKKKRNIIDNFQYSKNVDQNFEYFFLKTCSQSPITESLISILTKFKTPFFFPKEISLHKLLLKLNHDDKFINNNNNDNNYVIFNYPCGYTYLSENILLNLETLYDTFNPYSHFITIIYMGLEKADLLAGKDNLWTTVMNYYKDHHKVEKYLPKTYVMNDSFDRHSLFQKIVEFKQYNLDVSEIHHFVPIFFKKNVQRKQGIYVAKNLDQAMDRLTNQSIHQDRIAQHLIQNIIKYENHVVTLRVYIIGIYNNSTKQTSFYRFNPIKCLYSERHNELITTSDKEKLQYLYNNRKFPLMLSTMFNNDQKKLKKINTLIHTALEFVMKPYESILGKFEKKNIVLSYKNAENAENADNTNNADNTDNNEKIIAAKNFVHQFQIFGADVILQDFSCKKNETNKMNESTQDEFGVKIVEVNKGPSLVPVNNLDYDLKQTMIINAFQLVNDVIQQNKINTRFFTRLN